MKKIIALMLMPVLSGCFSSQPPAITTWLVKPIEQSVDKLPRKFDSARVSQVVMRSPYETSMMCILRGDGSVAFDYYNRFATSPAAMLKGPSIDLIRSSGLFKSVCGPSSALHTDLGIEIIVTKFALDCTSPVPMAAAEVLITVINQKDRALVKAATGEATMAIGEGDYAAAFSYAYTRAISQALTKF